MADEATVGAYMTENVHVIQMENTLPAARKMMEEHGIRHLPVVDGKNIVGLLSERDLNKLEGFPMFDMNLVSVPDAMSTLPYIVYPDTPMVEMLRTMKEQRLGSAVVTDRNGKVVGIFTATDAISILIDKME